MVCLGSKYAEINGDVLSYVFAGCSNCKLGTLSGVLSMVSVYVLKRVSYMLNNMVFKV